MPQYFSPRSSSAAEKEFQQAEILNKEKVNKLAATLATNTGARELRQGHLSAALEQLRSAVKLNPRSAAAHYQLGLALRAQGDLSQAAAQFLKAHQLDPQLASAPPYSSSAAPKATARQGNHP